MTKEKKEDAKFEFPEEFDPLEEGVVLPAELEPDHPGWLSIAEIMKISDPVFEKSKFLIGYQESSNVYVLAGDYLTIVDPGNDYTVFTDLEKLGFNPLDIKKVVVTHGHRDHCMGVFELLRFPPIYESKDIEIINHEGGPQEFEKILTEQGFSLTQVKGGETLELSGFEWEVIHTPGHTIDSICLYHGPTKTAITGDTVIPHAIGDADKTAGGRLDHYLYGLKQLLQKDIENILPGHGVPMAATGRRQPLDCGLLRQRPQAQQSHVDHTQYQRHQPHRRKIEQREWLIPCPVEYVANQDIGWGANERCHPPQQRTKSQGH